MRSFLLMAATCLLVASASDVRAGVLNGGFESPGGSSGNPFPQADLWYGDARTALHSSFGPGTFGSLGANFVFNQGSNAPASQTLSDVFAVGSVYTFDGFGVHNNSSADVVFEIGYDDNGQYELLAEATYDQNPLNEWTKHEGVSYTPAPGGPEVGKNVVVRFRSTQLQGVWLDELALTLTDAPTFGDVNGDDLVDLADYIIIRDNFQSSVSNRSDGDLTGPTGASDGVVDFYDFLEWGNFFPSATSLSFSEVNALAANYLAVPEPTSFFLGTLCLLGYAVAFRRS